MGKKKKDKKGRINVVDAIYELLEEQNFTDEKTLGKLVHEKTGSGTVISAPLSKLRRRGYVEYAADVKPQPGVPKLWRKHPLLNPLKEISPDIRTNRKNNEPIPFLGRNIEDALPERLKCEYLRSLSPQYVYVLKKYKGSHYVTHEVKARLDVEAEEQRERAILKAKARSEAAALENAPSVFDPGPMIDIFGDPVIPPDPQPATPAVDPVLNTPPAPEPDIDLDQKLSSTQIIGQIVELLVELEGAIERERRTDNAKLKDLEKILKKHFGVPK